jgi:hypothetical protein
MLSACQGATGRTARAVAPALAQRLTWYVDQRRAPDKWRSPYRPGEVPSPEARLHHRPLAQCRHAGRVARVRACSGHRHPRGRPRPQDRAAPSDRACRAWTADRQQLAGQVGLRASFSRKTGELRGFRRATDRARERGDGLTTVVMFLLVPRVKAAEAARRGAGGRSSSTASRVMDSSSRRAAAPTPSCTSRPWSEPDWMA